MDFKKDLLVIDTEFSGFDLKKHDLLQLAAVLLDRKTLKEKAHFNSYIKPKHWRTRDKASMAVNKISWQQVKDAPSLEKVIKEFDQAFDADKVMLTSYVGFADKRYLLHAFSEAGVKFKFDYHYFDIWSFCYAHLARQGKLITKKDFAGFGIESMLKMFKIKSTGKMHDALADCRIEAEILRRVIKIYN